MDCIGRSLAIMFHDFRTSVERFKCEVFVPVHGGSWRARDGSRLGANRHNAAPRVHVPHIRSLGRYVLVSRNVV